MPPYLIHAQFPMDATQDIEITISPLSLRDCHPLRLKYSNNN